MADVTSVIIEHNFDLTSIEAFYKDFSSRLGQPVFETYFDETEKYSPPVPDDFVGWVNYMDLYFDQKGNTDYIDLMNNITNYSIIICAKYAEINLYGINSFFEWIILGFQLNRLVKNDVSEDLLKDILKERTHIFNVAKLFGGSKCYMFNGDKHGQLKENILYSSDIELELEKNKIKLKKIYFQALDNSVDYGDSIEWYDSILIDDFSDLQ